MYKMTSAELDEMYKRKYEYIKRLQLAFKLDLRSDVKNLDYHRNFNGCPEVVEIEFNNGHKRYINVTGNSNSANYRQIGNAVYGGEVIGEIFHTDENNAGTDV